MKLTVTKVCVCVCPGGHVKAFHSFKRYLRTAGGHRVDHRAVSQAYRRDNPHAQTHRAWQLSIIAVYIYMVLNEVKLSPTHTLISGETIGPLAELHAGALGLQAELHVWTQSYRVRRLPVLIPELAMTVASAHWSALETEYERWCIPSRPRLLKDTKLIPLAI